jgi:hypothetical protein
LFLSIILTDTRKYCVGAGWENNEIALEIKSTTTMQDCYKKLIDSWCDRSATVTGRQAKYLDECDASQYVTATMYKYIYREARVHQTVWRTVMPYSQNYCKSLPLIGSSSSSNPQSVFLGMAYDNLGLYMKHRMAGQQ